MDKELMVMVGKMMGQMTELRTEMNIGFSELHNRMAR